MPPKRGAFRQFPLTARGAAMELRPLSVSEQRGAPNASFLEQLFDADPPTTVELAAISSWHPHRYRLMVYHFPDPKQPKSAKSSHRFPHGEIDFLVRSRRRSGLVAIEVKARNHFKVADTKRLRQLRDALDDGQGARDVVGPPPFVAGLTLCCGDVSVREVDDRIWRAPLSILWAHE